MIQRADDRQRLLPHGPAERLVFARIFGTGENEVVPEHDPGLVARVAELLRRVDAAAPDAEQIEVRACRKPDELAAAPRVDLAVIEVRRYEVAALAEDPPVVDFENEIGPLDRMFRLIDRHLADAEFPRDALAEEFDFGRVAERLARAAREPELRTVERQFDCALRMPFRQLEALFDGVAGFGDAEFQRSAHRPPLGRPFHDDAGGREIVRRQRHERKLRHDGVRRVLEPDIAQDADVLQPRLPVPAALMLCLAEPGPLGQVAHLAAATDLRRMVAILEYAALKRDDQRVFPLPELPGHIDAVRHERIGRAPGKLAVQIDLRQHLKPLENEMDDRIRSERPGRSREGAAVDPVALLHPARPEAVHAEIRIVEQPVLFKRPVDRLRHLGGHEPPRRRRIQRGEFPGGRDRRTVRICEPPVSVQRQNPLHIAPLLLYCPVPHPVFPLQ